LTNKRQSTTQPIQTKRANKQANKAGQQKTAAAQSANGGFFTGR
jgi:hypothetical protein